MSRLYPSDKVLFGTRQALHAHDRRLLLLLDNVDAIWAVPRDLAEHRLQDSAHRMLRVLARMDTPEIGTVMCSKRNFLRLMIRGLPVPDTPGFRTRPEIGDRLNVRVCPLETNGPENVDAVIGIVKIVYPDLSELVVQHIARELLAVTRGNVGRIVHCLGQPPKPTRVPWP